MILRRQLEKGWKSPFKLEPEIKEGGKVTPKGAILHFPSLPDNVTLNAPLVQTTSGNQNALHYAPTAFQWAIQVMGRLEIGLEITFKDKEKGVRISPNPLILFGSGGWIRTNDLWVMSPTSYQTAPPRVM